MTSAEIARGLAIAQGLLREYVDTLDGRQLEDTQADEITLAQAAVEAAFQEQCGETMRKLRAERDRASSLFASIATTHAKLAAWARDELSSHDQARFFAVLANGAPDWKTASRNLAVDLLAMTAERDELAARLEAFERAEPAAWIEHELQGTGLRHLHFERRANTLRDDVVAPVWTALIARPIQACKPEQASMSLDDALELHVIADGTKIRPACDWPGNCRHQLTSHRKKN